MKTIPLSSAVLATALLLAGFQAPASAAASDEVKKEIIGTYTSIASHSFNDAHKKAIELRKAIAAFTAAPSNETHIKAKEAWIAARIPFLQTKVFRDTKGTAQLIDGWPIEASYLDYDLLNPNAGIVGNKDQALDKESIVALNKGGKISCGFHAIEFLLWGLDLREDGPGSRNHIEFDKQKNANAIRRADFLKVCADLLVDHLGTANANWQQGTVHSQIDRFSELPTDEALAEILENIATTSASISADVAKVSKSRKQEDESSNFSDTTHLDLMYSVAGIANLVAGAYVGDDKKPKVQGKGVMALEKEGSQKMKLGINRAMLSVTSFRPPFDKALPAPDSSRARTAIKEIETSLSAFASIVEDLAKELGVEVKPAR